MSTFINKVEYLEVLNAYSMDCVQWTYGIFKKYKNNYFTKILKIFSITIGKCIKNCIGPNEYTIAQCMFLS